MIRFIFIIVLVFSRLILYSQDKVIVSPFITIDGETVFTSTIPQLDILNLKILMKEGVFISLKEELLRFILTH